MSLFIVFEGVDHSGKTTLIKKLINELQKQHLKVFSTWEPGGSELGEGLRSLLLKSNFNIYPTTELLMFVTSRFQHLQEKILPALKTVDIVICDRYFYSTFVYQGLFKKIDYDLIFSLHQKLGIFQRIPDLVFFLSSNPRTLQQRSEAALAKEDFVDRFNHQNQINYFAKMQKFYLQTFANLHSYVGELETIYSDHQALDKNVVQVVKTIMQKWKKNQ